MNEKLRETIDPNIREDLDKTISFYESVGATIRKMEGYTLWLYEIFKNSCLPSVEIEDESKIALDKTKLTIFVTLLDDLADDYKIRDKKLLEKAIQITRNQEQKQTEKYLEVTKKIWQEVSSSVKKYPRYDDFRDLFFFDLEQFLDSVRYAFLSNEMKISNKLEDDRYLPHNFMVVVWGDMDLMHSPNFKINDLSELRPVLYWAQDVCHIANVIRTYPREIRQRDFSCPIISLGLRKGLVNEQTIVEEPDRAQEKLKELVPYFEEKISNKFEKMKEKIGKTETVSIEKYLERVKKAYQKIKTCEYSIPEKLDTP